MSDFWELEGDFLRERSNVVIFQEYGSIFLQNIGIFISATQDEKKRVSLHFGNICLSKRYHAYETRFHEFIIKDEAYESILKKDASYWICYFDQKGYSELTLRSGVGAKCPFADLVSRKSSRPRKMQHKVQIPGVDPVDSTKEVRDFVSGITAGKAKTSLSSYGRDMSKKDDAISLSDVSLQNDKKTGNKVQNSGDSKKNKQKDKKEEEALV
ncbi:hypothetical protein LSTR_LSTR017207 [Laodelphax striatellus]|uniref:Uncharacterized protein n=1 Tax=Laodelphax striatellus TaxID=195883 RepID=A0A482XSR5_LAOST|nr:hypothetical protein LSTR_LSTR017207 [Laodelphax striatellus]